jgi:hypothetical protein
MQPGLLVRGTAHVSQDRSGKSLELAVGRIQQMLAPDCTISYREQIQNRLGLMREFDVVFRGTFGGHPALGVIECKDWGHKVGTPELDAFITKTRDINASLRMIVSPKGFTEPALRQARDAGVGVLSLLPDDPHDAGFSVGVLWYGRLHTLEDIRAEIRFSGPSPVSGSYGESDLLYRGKPVLNWFLRALSTTDYTSIDTDLLARSVEFGKPLRVSISGQSYKVAAIRVTATHTFRKKKRFMQISGDAFFDWDTGSLRAPATGRISVGPLDPNLSDWEECTEEIPPTGPLQMVIDRYRDFSHLTKEDVPTFPTRGLRIVA